MAGRELAKDDPIISILRPSVLNISACNFTDFAAYLPASQPANMFGHCEAVGNTSRFGFVFP